MSQLVQLYQSKNWTAWSLGMGPNSDASLECSCYIRVLSESPRSCRFERGKFPTCAARDQVKVSSGVARFFPLDAQSK
jgi:hypothetical protein